MSPEQKTQRLFDFADILSVALKNYVITDKQYSLDGRLLDDLNLLKEQYYNLQDPETLRAILNLYGLDIRIEEREVETLVISPAQQQ